jgi:hypothetical protein
MISNMMAQLRGHTVDIDEGLLRHMVLNTLRYNRMKFKDTYGDLVIACDDKNYWRRKVFPYYKAARKKSRDASDLDWNSIFTALNKIRDELKEYFPYPVIQVDTCEADDIISVLCHDNDHPDGFESILILSGDKDFIQLQKYDHVDQYDPTRKRWIKHNNPQKYIFEHIIRGDAGDGVPNILSDDDTFIDENKRQRPIRAKKLDSWVEDLMDGKSPYDVFDNEARKNYFRNSALIDLSFEFLPYEGRNEILNQFRSQQNKGRDKLFNYFVKNKLKNLMDSLQEF